MKTILITGSSRGIGAGIAEYFIKKQWFVYVTYLKEKSIAEQRFGKYSNCRIVKLDVRLEADCEKLAKMIKEKHKGLDVLVNSAAVEIPNRIEDLSLDNWNEILETKLTGAFLITKHLLPFLKKTKGLIFNITSALSHKGTPRYPAHSAAEAGLISLSKTMAIDFAKYGIRTNMINPTTTRTDMWKSIGGYEDEKLWKDFANQNPLGRVSTPEDIARSIYLLTLPEAEYLNGNEIYVNGGAHIK